MFNVIFFLPLHLSNRVKGSKSKQNVLLKSGMFYLIHLKNVEGFSCVGLAVRLKQEQNVADPFFPIKFSMVKNKLLRKNKFILFCRGMEK